VVASVLSPGALPALLSLARSATAAGFPCIVAIAFGEPSAPLAELSAEEASLVVLVEPPGSAALPRARWCNRTQLGQYWHRRAQFSRLHLWRRLLDLPLDVLAVDASLQLARNPLPALRAMRTRAGAQYGDGAPPDLVGATPGWFMKQIGLSTGVWIRSTADTRALARRAEARVPGCWDETVFTEELNWGAGANATCCHAECLSKHLPKSAVKIKLPAGARAVCAAEGALPLAPPPPRQGRNGWADPAHKNGTKRYGTTRAGQPLYQRAWREDAYNTLAIPMHRFGRCTGRDASCIGLHPSCPPPPPPFTKEVALAGRKQEAERARLRGIRHRAEKAARAAKLRNASLQKQSTKQTKQKQPGIGGTR
jgi:hypothetical protein